MKLLIGGLLFALVACSGEPEEPENPYANMSTDSLRQHLDDTNINATKQQELEIMSYLNKKGYDNMISTGTGLRYEIYERGKGDSAACDMQAHVRYDVGLLNDTICYSNRKTGDVQTFTICLDYVETGLHEGITYMNEGDKARLVMPSVLAHGLLGDRDCIPPLSPIVIDIELVKLTR